ncbi:MAG: hypothetical protein JWN01_237 [Patescibacteria group bacterium]|nr:hypothetical protein [Patescibacteria group bacterium]
MTSRTTIKTGDWGKNVTWELYTASTPPPTELCTAVMCVAITRDKIRLARSQRGWGMLGGHIEEGETPEDALRREALEEGGFTIDSYQLFAIREITHLTPAPHPQAGKTYPFPVSYMAYYWATTDQALALHYGEEIIESASFTISEIPMLQTPDQPVIKAGWLASGRSWPT